MLKYTPILAAFIASPAAACDINIPRFAIAAADAATTIYAIEERNAHETNPAARLVIGKHPKPGEVVAFKLGGAIVQQALSCALFGDKPKTQAKFDLITNIAGAAVVGLNMRYVF